MTPLNRNPFENLWKSVRYATNPRILIALPLFAAAQEWARAAPVEEVAATAASVSAHDATDLALDEVIVTAVPGTPSSKLNSSLSVSTLSAAEIQQSDPSSA